MVARRLFYVMVLAALLAGCAGRTPRRSAGASGAHVTARAHCDGAYQHRRPDYGAHDRADRGQCDGDAGIWSVPGRTGRHGHALRGQEFCNGCAASAEPDRRHTAG